MIGKHIWNFINNPTSLVARLYKAKYYHECNILQAQKGASSSFIWNGISEANESFSKGYRWVLGDEKDISIFQDPWLRGKRDFRVEDHHNSNSRSDKVYEFIRPNIKTWDVQKIQNNFHLDDVVCILKTRIPQNFVSILKTRIPQNFVRTELHGVKQVMVSTQ